MLFQLEYAAVVETDALENSVPIQKAVIEHRNFRVCFRKEFAIDVNRERLRGPLRRARLVRRFYRSRLPLPWLVFYQCCASTAVCRFCKHKKISAVKQSIQAAFRPPSKNYALFLEIGAGGMASVPSTKQDETELVVPNRSIQTQSRRS